MIERYIGPVTESLWLADAYAAAQHLTLCGYPTDPRTIRQWASRGVVQRHGRDERGRTLYDLAELQRRVGLQVA